MRISIALLALIVTFSNLSTVQAQVIYDLTDEQPVICENCRDVEDDHVRYLRDALKQCHLGGGATAVPIEWVINTSEPPHISSACPHRCYSTHPLSKLRVSRIRR